MRVDKYLKLTRIIKRRTIAQEACDGERVLINNKIAKSGTQVKVGDIIQITFGSSVYKYEVLGISEHVKKEDATTLYRIVE